MSKQLCSWLQKKTLTLEEKIHVLDHAEKNPKVGCRKLAELFSVGKTQIAALIKDNPLTIDCNMTRDSISQICLCSSL